MIIISLIVKHKRIYIQVPYKKIEYSTVIVKLFQPVETYIFDSALGRHRHFSGTGLWQWKCVGKRI